MLALLSTKEPGTAVWLQTAATRLPALNRNLDPEVWVKQHSAAAQGVHQGLKKDSAPVNGQQGRVPSGRAETSESPALRRLDPSDGYADFTFQKSTVGQRLKCESAFHVNISIALKACNVDKKPAPFGADGGEIDYALERLSCVMQDTPLAASAATAASASCTWKIMCACAAT